MQIHTAKVVFENQTKNCFCLINRLAQIVDNFDTKQGVCYSTNDMAVYLLNYQRIVFFSKINYYKKGTQN